MSLQRRGTVRTVGENAGFSLVELMISLVLGLLVTAAAVGIFLSNQRTFRATESLARIQEDGQGLLVRTRETDGFYRLLNRAVAAGEIELEAVAPADDDVGSVYQYLLGNDSGGSP